MICQKKPKKAKKKKQNKVLTFRTTALHQSHLTLQAFHFDKGFSLTTSVPHSLSFFLFSYFVFFGGALVLNFFYVDSELPSQYSAILSKMLHVFGAKLFSSVHCRKPTSLISVYLCTQELSSRTKSWITLKWVFSWETSGPCSGEIPRGEDRGVPPTVIVRLSIIAMYSYVNILPKKHSRNLKVHPRE